MSSLRCLTSEKRGCGSTARSCCAASIKALEPGRARFVSTTNAAWRVFAASPALPADLKLQRSLEADQATNESVIPRMRAATVLLRQESVQAVLRTRWHLLRRRQRDAQTPQPRRSDRDQKRGSALRARGQVFQSALKKIRPGQLAEIIHLHDSSTPRPPCWRNHPRRWRGICLTLVEFARTVNATQQSLPIAV